MGAESDRDRDARFGWTGMSLPRSTFAPRDASASKRNGKLTIVRLGTKEDSQHPGYFWLAYTWQNLVPSCWECNGHKTDQFPVAASYVGEPSYQPAKSTLAEMATYRNQKGTDYYYPVPEELDAVEGRLLLNPLLDNPRRAIYFKPRGFIEALTSAGSLTIEAYGLDTFGLQQQRYEKQDHLKRKFFGAAQEADTPEEKLELCRRVLLKYVAGDEDFSEAALDFLIGDDGRGRSSEIRLTELANSHL
jgi:hypothetical protein